MSSGPLSLQAIRVAKLALSMPPRHPSIPFSKWEKFSAHQIFGDLEDTVADGLRGAPIVAVDGTGAQRFFHSRDGMHALCTQNIDMVAGDLVEGDWVLVRALMDIADN